MEEVSEKSQYFLIEDVRKNPELIAELLFKEQDVSVILEKRGNRVRYTYLKTYDKETVRILEEVKSEYRKIKEKGYTREQAFKDFTDARREINKYL
ncbi:hypothetical protein FJZ31_07790 [Candidatus Poribacteria bacterium]|nr:hypothetical protein [Candidatus Poribacteria bacterium]